MMADGEICAQLVSELDTDDFYSFNHQRIFDAIISLFAEGTMPDPVVVAARLKGVQKVSALDVHACMEAITTTRASLKHAVVLKEHAVRRRLVRAGEEIQNLSLQTGFAASQLVSEAEQMVFDAAARFDRITPTGFAQASAETLSFLREVHEHPASVGDIPTGLEELDHLIGGLHPGSLYFIAARPGVGKSAMAIGAARHAATLGYHVLFISIEMTTRELTTRLLCSEAQVSLSKVIRKRLATDDIAKLTEATQRIAHLPLTFVDTGVKTVRDVASVSRRHRDVDLVVVDYVQLLDAASKRQSRNEEVAEISQGLKLLAKDMRIPVLALSQLNREVESRKGPPKLSDLRDSGALEQDADCVILMHKDLEQDVSMRNWQVDLIVAKHRNGPTGQVVVDWYPTLTKFQTPIERLKGLGARLS